MSRFINGYACDISGERIIYYDCDPDKNKECKKVWCAFRGILPWKRGTCDKTTDKAARRAGTKPFYIKLGKRGDRVVFGREYIEEAKP